MITPFKSWCTAQGILTPLQLCGELPYRYMKYDDSQLANGSIGKDEITGPILRVPLHACIIADSPVDLSKRLAEEKDMGEESKFAPYINILPELDYYKEILPRFWSEERIDLVTDGDGGQVYRKIQEDDCPDVDPWAHACVTSRANYVQKNGYAMTPILDMINHDSASITSAAILEDELFLSVDNTFQNGEEVFISYGDLTNLETLCNYGFISDKKTACNSESIDVLMMRQQPVKVTISSVDGSLDPGSIAILRSYLASPAEISAKENEREENGAKGTSLSLFASPISESNEEEVFSFIASFIDEALYDARSGVEKASEKNDDLVERYLTARAETLVKGLDFVKSKFPGIEY